MRAGFLAAVVVSALAVGVAAARVCAQDLPRRRPYVSQHIRTEKSTDVFGYPLATADKVEILDLLRARRFAEIDRVLGDYERDAESSVFLEDWIGDAIEACAVPDPSLRTVFDEWIQTKPDSAVARLARAAYRSSLAWAARGHKFAAETTPAQLDAMRDYAESALVDARYAVKLKPRFGEAFRYLVNIALLIGSEGERRQAFEGGTQVAPQSFRLRAAYMNSLLPRWGGSYAAMEALAAESEQLVGLNPRLRLLRGYIPWDRGRSLPKSKRSERRKAFGEALSYGPHWVFFESRANEYEADDDYAEALQDYTRAQWIKPQDARLLRKIASMQVHLKESDQARGALAAADQFDLAGAERNLRAGLASRLAVVRAHRAYTAGDSAAAHAELATAQKRLPGNAQSHYWRGRVFLKEGNLSAALQEFEDAVRSDPRDIESYKNIDYILAREGKWDLVISHWDQYLRLEPGASEAYLERAGAYHHKGDERSARADLERACDLGQQKACELARHVSHPLP